MIKTSRSLGLSDPLMTIMYNDVAFDDHSCPRSPNDRHALDACVGGVIDSNFTGKLAMRVVAQAIM